MTTGRQRGFFMLYCDGCKTNVARYVFHSAVRTSGISPRLQKMGEGIALCPQCIAKPPAAVKSRLWQSCLDALKTMTEAQEAPKKAG